MSLRPLCVSPGGLPAWWRLAARRRERRRDERRNDLISFAAGRLRDTKTCSVLTMSGALSGPGEPGRLWASSSGFALYLLAHPGPDADTALTRIRKAARNQGS